MNQFEYTLIIKDVKAMTTLKAREAIIRKMSSESTLDSYSSVHAATPENIRRYKIFRLALNGYTGKYLPDFLYSHIRGMENALLKWACTYGNRVTYEQLVDVFEFTTEAESTHLTPLRELKCLTTLIGSNPLPIKITYNLSVPTEYGSLLDDMPNTIDLTYNRIGPPALRTIIYVENLKRTEHYNNHTVIEDILQELYACLKTTKKATLKNTVVALEHRLDGYKQVLDTMSKFKVKEDT